MLNLSLHWSPIALIGLVMLCLLFAFGIRQARKGNVQGTPLQKRRIVAFIVAVVMMAVVFLTPIDNIARTQLFFMHMVQAVTLTTVCAPLLLYACPAWLLRPLLNQPLVRPVARALTQPVISSVIFNINVVAWHAPGLYHCALGHVTVYHVALLWLLVASLLNCWPLVVPVRE